MKHWPLFLVSFVMCFVGYITPHGQVPEPQLMAMGLGYGVLVFFTVYTILLVLQSVTRLELGLFKE